MAPPTSNEANKSNGPSMAVQLGLLAGLTVAAIGIGWFVGEMMRSDVGPTIAQSTAEKPEQSAQPVKDPDATSSNPLIIDLVPITTNLAFPSETWVRVELAAFFTEPPASGVVERIQDDLLTYLRTVKIYQIEGASGFAYLKADFKERANMIADGTVEEILIKTMLFE